MINKLHKRTLRLNYNDYEFSFEDLLTKDGFFTIHCYTIQAFAIELYKVYNDISQTILEKMFTRNSSSILHSKSDFNLLPIRTLLKGLISIRFLAQLSGT